MPRNFQRRAELLCPFPNSIALRFNRSAITTIAAVHKSLFLHL